MEQHHAPQQGKTSGRWVQCSGTTHPSSSPSYFSLSSSLPHSAIGQSLMNGSKIKQIGKVTVQEKTNKVQ